MYGIDQKQQPESANMFSFEQEKGLFTFYREQSEIEDMNPSMSKILQKSGVSQFLERLNVAHLKQKKNQKFVVGSETKDPISYRNNQACKIVNLKTIIARAQKYSKRTDISCMEQINQRYMRQPNFLQTQKNLFLNQSNLSFNIENKSVSLQKIKNFRNQEQKSLHKKYQSVILTGRSDYYHWRKAQISQNFLPPLQNRLSSNQENQLRKKEKQQIKKMSEMCPLIHFENNNAVNYFIPKVKMKSKVIDKVFQLKNQKEIKIIRSLIQTQKLIQKQYIQQSFRHVPERKKISSVRKSLILPSINTINIKNSQKKASQEMTALKKAALRNASLLAIISQQKQDGSILNPVQIQGLQIKGFNSIQQGSLS